VQLTKEVKGLLASGEALLRVHGERDPSVWVRYHRGSIVLGAWVRIFARGKKIAQELEAWSDTPEGAKESFAALVAHHAKRKAALVARHAKRKATS
jgi:hypothetical protein